MTQPPYGPPPSYPGQPPHQVTWFDPGAAPMGAGVPGAPSHRAPSRTGRRIAIGATVAGVLALGGAGYAVAAYLSGGGAQPEEALPADTIGFVKLDLDPAAGQKTAVASLLAKFPALGDGVDDIRQDAVDGLLDFGDARLDFAEDVDPWLGDRMAAAVVPAPESDQGFAVVFALAVDDQQAMADTLREVGDDLGFAHAVRDDFLILTEDQDVADRVAAEESRLSEDDDYSADLAALDGDQIAVAWADLSAAQQLLGEALDAGGTVGLDQSFGELSGRIVWGLHAENDALEMVGMDFSVSDVGPGPRPTEPTRLVQDLPEDTTVALSASGVGDVLADHWDDVEAAGMAAGFEEMFPNLELPDDLRTVLGSDLLVALRGDLENPQFGIRAVTDDPERATDILKGFNYAFDLGIRTVPAPVDDGYVLATDTTTARALAGDDPGLADTDAFQAAVPGADDATLVGYVDLAAVLDQVPDSSDFHPGDYEALQALGITSTPTEKGSRVVLRVTAD